MRFQGALDQEINLAVQKFSDRGIALDVGSIYNALQTSNSSLKRRPKRVLQDSITRVLHSRFSQQPHADTDSEAELEATLPKSEPAADSMNKSLRANLSSTGPSAMISEDSSKPQRTANDEPATKRKKSSNIAISPPTDISLRDLGGLGDVVKNLRELLVRPLLFPHVYAHMGVKINRGILLHGPPGCGKTMVIRAFAGTMGVPFLEILGPSIVSSMSGDSEKALREQFDEAQKHAPSIIFLDEIDAIAPKRDSSQSQMEKRIVAQLLTCMDSLGKDPTKPVVVVAATNRPDSLDPALRRGGRFGTEICIGIPNQHARERILMTQTRKTPIADDVNFGKLAKMTAGFVGADLDDLVTKAVSWQLDGYFHALEHQMHPHESQMPTDDEEDPNLLENKATVDLVQRSRNIQLPVPKGYEDPRITMAAFEAVFPGITPSLKREGFETTPNVSWDDIGALQSVREELQMSIVEPIKNPGTYKSFGLDMPIGMLLWGPPGCGKTLLAKATAAESMANFIAVKGPELLNKYVGESEAAVRRVFTRARSSAPCVIFFDELDALVPRRDHHGSEVSNRIVNTLLTELDGVHDRKDIWIIGATNRPDVIDEAILRPGRLGTCLYVDLPNEEGRKEIFRALVRTKNIQNVDEILPLVGGCEGFSGADLSALVAEAGFCAIRRKAPSIAVQDFELARTKIQGSVQNIATYHALKKQFGQRG